MSRWPGGCPIWYCIRSTPRDSGPPRPPRQARGARRVAALDPPALLAEERVHVPGGTYTKGSPAEPRAMLDRKDFCFGLSQTALVTPRSGVLLLTSPTWS